MTHKLLPILISALILSACQSALPPDNTSPVATAAPHNLILYYHGDHTDSALRQPSPLTAQKFSTTIPSCTASPSASLPTKA